MADRLRPTGPASLVFRDDARVERLAGLRAFVRVAAADLGAGTSGTGDLVQAIDEWVTNVAVHGYRGGGGPVEVELARDEDGILVRIRDRAPAFDPADARPFDPTVPLERRRPGGMGIYLIREIMDRFTHQPLADGGNEVTMHLTDSTGGDA